MAYRSGSTAAYTTATSVVVPVPTGAAINDIAVVHIFVQHAATTITAVPTGFTLDTTLQHVGSARVWTHYQYWKRLSAADTGSYTWTLSASDSTMATCGLYSGRLQSGSPYDVTTVTATAPAGTDTVVNCPATTITPVTAGVDLVWGAFPFNSAATTDIPASFTQAAFDASAMLQAYRANQPASSSGSLTQSTPRTDLWSVQLSALRPVTTSVTGTVTLVGSGSLTVTGINTVVGAVGFAGAGSLSPNATVTVSSAVTFAGTGVLTATATVTSTDTYSDTYGDTYGVTSQAATVSFVGAGSLSVTPLITHGAAVALSGAGALTVTPLITHPFAVTLAGAGALTVAPLVTGQVTAPLSGAGTLAVTALITHLPVLSLAGGSTLTVTVSGSQTAAVALTGAGTLTIAAVVTQSTVVALTGSGTLTLAPLITHQLAVTLTGAGSLAISGGSMATLPAAVTFGTITAWFGTGVNQAPDADGYPDLVAATGTVTFSPVKVISVYPAASPAPLILAPKTVVATLDSNGYLVGTKTGEQLVRLIAGAWLVSFQLAGITLPTFNLTVTAGVTTDLATVIPT